MVHSVQIVFVINDWLLNIPYKNMYVLNISQSEFILKYQISQNINRVKIQWKIIS